MKKIQYTLILVFKPVFLLVDDTIQESKIYEGEKNVTIIGGGRTPDNIRMFSDVEQFEYNQKRGYVEF